MEVFYYALNKRPTYCGWFPWAYVPFCTSACLLLISRLPCRSLTLENFQQYEVDFLPVEGMVNLTRLWITKYHLKSLDKWEEEYQFEPGEPLNLAGLHSLADLNLNTFFPEMPPLDFHPDAKLTRLVLPHYAVRSSVPPALDNPNPGRICQATIRLSLGLIDDLAL